MPRFTIRDLLWLMVVVGLLAAWWVEHSRQRALYQQLGLRYQFLEDASGYKIERLPDGTYRAWDGPKQKADGTWEHPDPNAPFP